MTTQDPDTAAAATGAAFKTTLAGAASLSLGGITESQMAMLGGLLIGLAGLLLQWWFQYRRDRREERLLQAKLRTLHVDDETEPVPL